MELKKTGEGGPVAGPEEAFILVPPLVLPPVLESADGWMPYMFLHQVEGRVAAAASLPPIVVSSDRYGSLAKIVPRRICANGQNLQFQYATGVIVGLCICTHPNQEYTLLAELLRIVLNLN